MRVSSVLTRRGTATRRTQFIAATKQRFERLSKRWRCGQRLKLLLLRTGRLLRITLRLLLPIILPIILRLAMHLM